MKSVTLTIVVGAAFAAAALLLLFGIRTMRPRRRPGWRGEFLLAPTAALGFLSGAGAPARIAAQEDPAEKDFEARVKEVEKDARWKKMRKFFRELARDFAAKGTIQHDPQVAAEEATSGIKVEAIKEQQKEDAKLLDKEAALGECAKFIGAAAYHLWRTKGAGREWTCYKMALPERNPHVPEQRALLKKQYEEGKISQEVYERLTRVLDEMDQLQRVMAMLNARNTALVFRLIRDMAGSRAVDIPRISPEVEKKIGELIEQLGAEEIEKRDEAQHAILQIGEGAIPQLKKALEHKSAEVRARAKLILDELE